MLEITKTTESVIDPNTTKLIIKASKEVISAAKLEPKQALVFEQRVNPEPRQEQGFSFKIY